MFNLRLFTIIMLTIIVSACGTAQNRYQLEDDDAYFSRKYSEKKAVITPDVDVNKIMQQYPSKINEGTFDNRPSETNQNAAMAYGKYRAETDSLYQKNPQLSTNYNPYKAPIFDEREEAKRLRRLNQMYNNNYRNSYWGNNYYGRNNYGYNRWNSYSHGWGIGFGMNSFIGFNSGWGYNNYGWGGSYYSPFNSWGYNPFYNGYNSYYGGYNSYYGSYYPTYYSPVIIDNKPSVPAPINRPRMMSGSDVPPTNNGTSGTVNTTPRTGQLMERANPSQVDVNTINPTQTNNGGATLKRDEVGNYQYTAPANFNRATGTTETPNYRNYSGYSRDNSESFPANRNENNAMSREQRNNVSNYQEVQPNNNRQYLQVEPNFSRPSYSAPSYSAPSAPRNGGGGNGGGSRPRM